MAKSSVKCAAIVLLNNSDTFTRRLVRRSSTLRASVRCDRLVRSPADPVTAFSEHGLREFPMRASARAIVLPRLPSLRGAVPRMQQLYPYAPPSYP
jgi:hypothetical protein